MRFKVTCAVDLKYKTDAKIDIGLYCSNYGFRCEMIDIKMDMKNN